MNIIFFDDPSIKQSLLPFTWIRPAAGTRIGILKIYEKWVHALKAGISGSDHFQVGFSFLTESYLAQKFPVKYTEGQVYINGALCPNQEILVLLASLKEGEGLAYGENVLAYRSSQNFASPQDLLAHCTEISHHFKSVEKALLLKHPWDIFQNNHQEIIADFERLTQGRKSAEIKDPYTKVYAPENLFIEPGASIKAAIINAENGPVYIGKNTKIHEGAILRGALALCEGAEINMGAKIRGDNTFGPYSKIGGEVNNTVVFGYSNKGHDGYLGNAVIGEWCNLGADTNSSNLKNNYSEIKIWDYKEEKLAPSGQQFCGLLMGDHSKCGINTMFNTGTVVGVAAIIFGSGFPKKFVPSFTWGGIEQMDTFKLEKMEALAETVMSRKGKRFTTIDHSIFEYIFERTATYRGDV